MDRYAVFVDAEYLHAEGGVLCCGSSDRREILLYGSGANDFLVGLAADACGLRPLRTYWYDTSSDGLPTPAQQLVASLPNMKLCLERPAAAGRPSPVSLAIQRDLMALAENKAVCDAFLLTADESLADTIRQVQNLGVRVIVVCVRPRQERQPQLDALSLEADDVVKLSKDDVARFIRRRRAPDDESSDSYDPFDSVVAAATEFADRWLYRATDEEFDALLDQRPRIPESLDGDLLYAVENVIGGSLRGQNRLRRAVRQAFWQRIALDEMD